MVPPEMMYLGKALTGVNKNFKLVATKAERIKKKAVDCGRCEEGERVQAESFFFTAKTFKD